MERFADTGVELSDFATHFVVECPRCQGKALVTSSHRLQCTSCHHTEEKGRWYGYATAYLSVKCRECHEQIRETFVWKNGPKSVHNRCKNCGDAAHYDVSIMRHPMHEGRMTDSVFGLPLWLQDTFREHHFWAFNYEHLNALSSYIQAGLRERGIEPRNTIKKNSAMFSRLPAFMTKGSNRKDIVRLVDDLLRK